ncbi:uncharacterized protein LOC121760567 [Salvia splendens]|uniref:uncharacterized protein LOC121760567 n=1 Tax=Salvia splendens TaxID=180675 RepID=UPI001C257A39|nr:uncharacterized protein LOC121760567 [Salvia splendens]
MEKVWVEQTETGIVMNLKEKESSFEGSFELMNSTSFAAQETETKFNKKSSSTLGGGSDSDMVDVDVNDAVRNITIDVLQWKILEIGHNLVGYPRAEVKRADLFSHVHVPHLEVGFETDIDLEVTKGYIDDRSDWEDSTCLVWDQHGRELSENKEHTVSRSRSRSEERGKKNFKQQLVKQELISQVVCRVSSLCCGTEFMSSGRVFDDLQNRKSILKLPGTLKITIDDTEGMSFLHQNTITHRGLKVSNLFMDENKVLMSVNAVVFGVAQVQVFRQKLYNQKDNVFIYEVMLWVLLTGKSPYAHNWEHHPIIVEEPKHHTERVLQIFEELGIEVKVYSGAENYES